MSLSANARQLLAKLVVCHAFALCLGSDKRYDDPSTPSQETGKENPLSRERGARTSPLRLLTEFAGATPERRICAILVNSYDEVGGSMILCESPSLQSSSIP
jgi:hypothetical protein